ncbi:hypothetical protein FHS56_000371 [Thermonema lapsum]|uniref:Probable queuosine precursor transporter n=1 Tax=Thermonema lapsum TaxID=28195 RepID=A0A846MN60_9BACT|nr:queuosine precursor transporter [Thermonema lapsum]NIK72885.1 hypothetical protein [Thermonema lapsum]
MHKEQQYYRKRTHLLLVLSGIFISNALLAEMIGVKIFSLEGLLGLPPAQIPIMGTRLDFNLSAGVVIWPVVFIISDIVNEYFGKGGVRYLSILTAALIAYAFVGISITTELPAADFWIAIYKEKVVPPIDINYAYNTIYRQGLGIIIGSLTAFLIGQLIDATVFALFKKRTGEKYIWLRATGSTIISQFIDSFVVIYIAFYIFGPWSLKEVISVGIINYSYKFLIAILTTPLLYIIHYAVERYLGHDIAKRLKDEAINSPLF